MNKKYIYSFSLNEIDWKEISNPVELIIEREIVGETKNNYIVGVGWRKRLSKEGLNKNYWFIKEDTIKALRLSLAASIINLRKSIEKRELLFNELTK